MLKECKNANLKCPNCNGNHFATDKSCPTYLANFKNIHNKWLSLKKFNLLLLNIHSLYNKQHNLLDLINKINSNVVCINETWLNDKISSRELIFNDFNYVRLDVMHKNCGGSIIMIKKGIEYEYINSILNEFIELLNISIKINDALEMSLILIYRPPYTSFF